MHLDNYDAYMSCAFIVFIFHAHAKLQVKSSTICVQWLNIQEYTSFRQLTVPHCNPFPSAELLISLYFASSFLMLLNREQSNIVALSL